MLEDLKTEAIESVEYETNVCINDTLPGCVKNRLNGIFKIFSKHTSYTMIAILTKSRFLLSEDLIKITN